MVGYPFNEMLLSNTIDTCNNMEDSPNVLNKRSQTGNKHVLYDSVHIKFLEIQRQKAGQWWSGNGVGGVGHEDYKGMQTNFLEEIDVNFLTVVMTSWLFTYFKTYQITL